MTGLSINLNMVLVKILLCKCVHKLTLSSFSLEAYHLLHSGRFGWAFAYLLGSPICSLGGFISVMLLNGGALL